MKKRKQRKLEAIAEGDIAGSESEREAVERYKRKRMRDQRAREQKASRDNKLINGMSQDHCIEWCRGKPTWLARECRSEKVVAAMARLGMSRKKQAVHARVFVVVSPSEAMKSRAGLRTPAALLGCCLVSPSLLSGSRLGRAVKLHSAIAKRWDIWISPRCAAAYTELWTMIQACMACPKEMNWKLHHGKEEVDDWSPLKAKFAKTPSKLFACISNTEAREERFASWRNTFTMEKFLDRIVEVESTIRGF